MLQKLIVLMSLLTITGCQAVSTALPYKPANCAMVGSSCTRTNHPPY